MTNTLMAVFGLFSLVGAIVVLLLGLYVFVTRKRRRQLGGSSAKQVQPGAPPQSLPGSPLLADVAPIPIRPSGKLPYALTTTLLSAAEQEFFAVALRAIPEDLALFPQVRLAGLVHTTERQPQRKQYDFYRIQAKTVDFVLCDARTTAPRLVIELDDSSHHRPDRRKRDAFVDEVLASVGLPILHVRWSPSYDVNRVRAAIFEQLGRAIYLPQAPTLPAHQQPNHTEPARTSSAHTRSNVAERAPRPAAPPPHAPAISRNSTPHPESSPQAAQRIVDAPPLTQRIVCGSCGMPVQVAWKHCGGCGAALA